MVGAEIQLTPLRTARAAIDRACDGAYLATSVGDYQSGVSGHAFGQTSLSFDELLILDGLFVVFGFAAGLSGKKSTTGKSYTAMRLLLSGLKNGRHAMVNAATVEMMVHNTHHAIAQGHIAAKFLSPVGGIAVGLGLLLAINNLILHRWQQQRERDLRMMRVLLQNGSGDEESRASKIASVMPPRRQKRMHAMTQVDAATDGLYVSGYTYMMAIMLGAHAAAGPVGWAILGFYALYTGFNCFYRGYKEQLKQVDYEVEYVKFLLTLSEEERAAYFKQNQDAKAYCEKKDLLDNSVLTDAKLTDYKAVLESKQTNLKSGWQYTLYKGCDWFFSIARKVSNYMKNMFSASFGVTALAAHSAIQQATQKLLPKIVGGVMAFGLLVMTFFGWRDKRQQTAKTQSASQNRTCLSVLCGGRTPVGHGSAALPSAACA